MARNVALPAGSRLEPGTILDPLPYRGGPLRHTPRLDDTTRAWYALLRYAEDLARRHAVLAASLTEDQQWSVQQQAALVADLYARFEEQRKEREYLRDQLRRFGATRKRASLPSKGTRRASSMPDVEDRTPVRGTGGLGQTIGETVFPGPGPHALAHPPGAGSHRKQ